MIISSFVFVNRISSISSRDWTRVEKYALCKTSLVAAGDRSRFSTKFCLHPVQKHVFSWGPLTGALFCKKLFAITSEFACLSLVCEPYLLCVNLIPCV